MGGGRCLVSLYIFAECSSVEIKVDIRGRGGGPTTSTYLRASFLLECSMMKSSMLFECMTPPPMSTLHPPDIIHLVSVPRPAFSIGQPEVHGYVTPPLPEKLQTASKATFYSSGTVGTGEPVRFTEYGGFRISGVLIVHKHT